MALAFLDKTFTLQAVGADGFTDALFDLANSFVRGSLDLVCGGTLKILLSFSRRGSETILDMRCLSFARTIASSIECSSLPEA